MWFILNEENEPIPADILEASRFLEDHARRVVAYSAMSDGSLLSTVFLCLDHGFGRSGRPVLFESLWFGGPHDGHQRRYETWLEAEEGHADMLEAYEECLKYHADKLTKM